MWRRFANVIPRRHFTDDMSHFVHTVVEPIARRCVIETTRRDVYFNQYRHDESSYAGVAVVPLKHNTMVTLRTGWQIQTVPCLLGDVLVTGLDKNCVSCTPPARLLRFAFKK